MLIIGPFKPGALGKSDFAKHLISQMDKIQLKLLLHDKQKLYAQMSKDKITGPAKEQVAQEIAEILEKLYVQLSPAQQ